MAKRNKTILVRSILIWLALTVVLATTAVLRQGLDLTQAHDDYMGYWDYRLAFFLIPWVGISLPVWAVGTWVALKKRPTTNDLGHL
jgi:hypothetical protein